MIKKIMYLSDILPRYKIPDKCKILFFKNKKLFFQHD